MRLFFIFVVSIDSVIDFRVRLEVCIVEVMM